MRRREFITFLAGAGVAWPRAARSQQPGKVYRLAILLQIASVDRVTGTRHRFWTAFFEELHRLGYYEGQNLAVEWRSSEGDATHVRDLARHVVALKPDMIFTPDFRMAGALKAATTSIPIVTISVDPVGVGLVASLARPGGNVTGFSVDAGLAIAGKRIGLLKEAVPAASRMAWLVPRRAWVNSIRGALREAAQAAGITLIESVVEAPAEEAEYRRVFTAMARDRVDSLLASSASENLEHRRLIAQLAAESRLPTIFGYRENVEAGGLMAYAVDLADIFRGAAGYIDRILKGTNPGELPFQQAAKFELVINLRTAKALGITIPESVLSRADEIIE
jgi:putative tryptophan/tyrosine transport system substrate-binding protein